MKVYNSSKCRYCLNITIYQLLIVLWINIRWSIIIGIIR